MQLSTIIRENAAWVDRSGFTVTADVAYSTVAIENGCDEDCIFLQGDEADEFNDKADELYNKTGDTTMDECLKSLAREYIECLG